MILLLLLRTPRFRVKLLAHGHTARRGQSWVLNPREFGHQWLGSSGDREFLGWENPMETEGKQYSICKWRQFGDHTMEGWGRWSLKCLNKYSLSFLESN